MNSEDVLYMAIGCPMTRFIKQRICAPRLDGLTAAQRKAEMDMVDDIQRRAAKLYAKATWEENK